MTQKFKLLWGLGLEIVDIDFKNEILEMQTRMICKSQLFPDFMGLELVKYRALELNQTLYEVYDCLLGIRKCLQTKTASS
jgi:hypothetical protein